MLGYLYFIACLAGTDMTICEGKKDVKIKFIIEDVAEERDVTPQQCMMYGQTEMSKWFEEHPEYNRVMRFSCSTKDKVDI